MKNFFKKNIFNLKKVKFKFNNITGKNDLGSSDEKSSINSEVDKLGELDSNYTKNISFHKMNNKLILNGNQKRTLFTVANDKQFEKYASTINKVLIKRNINNDEIRILKPGEYLSKEISDDDKIFYFIGHGNIDSKINLGNGFQKRVLAEEFIEELLNKNIDLKKFDLIVLYSCFTGSSGFAKELSNILNKPVIGSLYAKIISINEDGKFYFDHQTQDGKKPEDGQPLFILHFPKGWSHDNVNEYLIAHRSDIINSCRDEGIVDGLNNLVRLQYEVPGKDNESTNVFSIPLGQFNKKYSEIKEIEKVNIENSKSIDNPNLKN